MAYAETTNVSVERSKGQIDSLLTRHGATHQGMMNEPGSATIFFAMNDRKIVFKLPLPDQKERQFWETKRGRRTSEKAFQCWEQACRSRWRALFLCIKAKLESIESGIETFDEAFLAHVMTPDGNRFIHYAKPAIDYAYENEGPPKLTFGGGDG